MSRNGRYEGAEPLPNKSSTLLIHWLFAQDIAFSDSDSRRATQEDISGVPRVKHALVRELVRLTKQIAKKWEDWRKEEIEERAESLGQIALRIWPR
jgi:hypothetical protein